MLDDYAMFNPKSIPPFCRSLLDLRQKGLSLDQSQPKLHIKSVIKKYVQLFLLVFAVFGMAGQAAASNPCDEMAMGDAAIMSMSDCEEIQLETGSSQSDDTVNCNDMLQCSPVPATQVDNDIFVSQRSMVNAQVFTVRTDTLSGILSAPEFKPPKPSIA